MEDIYKKYKKLINIMKKIKDRPMLFSPISIRGKIFKNRIFMSPMSLYSAKNDGIPTNWHLAHWLTRIVGGVGLVMSESTSISPEGRLTENDLCLYNKSQQEAFKKYIDAIHDMGGMFGIQLGHCGRKSYGRTQGKGSKELVSCSPIKFDSDWETPVELSVNKILGIIKNFSDSAERAIKAGSDVIEIHAAHGYLIHQFLSPLSNKRKDKYGGSLENRALFLCQIVSEVRSRIGEEIPLFVRLSCTDWADDIGGFNIDDAEKVASMIAEIGADVVDCSSGGTLPITNPPLRQGYQLGFSSSIRKNSNILTAGVGLLSDIDFCESALIDKKCDFIFLGRELLRNPYWALNAAKYMGIKDIIPAQYIKSY
jgi:NADPH2 dehydrogenase